MKKLVALASVIFLCAGHAATAQIWKNAEKKIGKKIENKASQRAERKIDKAIDNGLDKVEEAPNQNKTSTPPASDEATSEQTAPATNRTTSRSLPSTNKANVKLPEQYTFNLGITYQTREDASKSKKAQEMIMWYADDRYLGMEADQAMVMVMDIDRNAMVNFMTQNKMYMIISTDYSQTLLESEDDKNISNEKMPVIEPLGKENILGYSCDIYQVTTDEGVSKLWYTTELKAGYNNFMAAMAFASKKKDAPASMHGMPGGVMMKMESQEKGSKKIMTMEATAIHKEGKKIRVSEYSSMGY
ncbi:MAG: DUF4412 domain-containing protein [Ferruginibacter sp.]|nr:DUF4412 domain-containing protein [Ferruginibacter sp.]